LCGSDYKYFVTITKLAKRVRTSVVDAVVAFGALIQLGGYTMLAHSA